MCVWIVCRAILRYDSGKDSLQSCMSVRFNTHGTQVLALRRRLPPILFNTFESDSICQFYHPDYYNSCTMKSCSFVGVNDEYVISGSDDFNLYMWRVTDADRKSNVSWFSLLLLLMANLWNKFSQFPIFHCSS